MIHADRKRGGIHTQATPPQYYLELNTKKHGRIFSIDIILQIIQIQKQLRVKLELYEEQCKWFYIFIPFVPAAVYVRIKSVRSHIVHV